MALKHASRLPLSRWAALLALLLCCATTLRAQNNSVPLQGPMREIDLEQRLGEKVPLDTYFVDELGNRVALREYFGRRPVVLVLAYYECPMLCTLVLNGMVDSLREVQYTPGKDYEVVVVSIDPDETPSLAAKKKKNYVNLYARPESEAGWHFLTGDEPDIRRVADAVGYRYAYDEATDQYAHPAAIMVLTADATISKYFYGAQFPPRDVRLGLVDASQGAVGTAVDKILLRCFVYDPMTGRYGPSIRLSLQVGAGLTMLAMGALIGGLIVRERRRVRDPQPQPAEVAP